VCQQGIVVSEWCVFHQRSVRGGAVVQCFVLSVSAGRFFKQFVLELLFFIARQFLLQLQLFAILLLLLLLLLLELLFCEFAEQLVILLSYASRCDIR